MYETPIIEIVFFNNCNVTTNNGIATISGDYEDATPDDEL